MPAARSRSRTPRRSDDAVFDAFAASGEAALDSAAARPARQRRRTGGPRTPLPLLPLIVGLAAIGVAYVAQSAHVTQSTYEAASLQAKQAQLQQQDEQLSQQLDRLRSSARIDAAAQQLGMRPPSHWSAVYAREAVLSVPGAPTTGGAPGGGGDPVQRLVAALSGSFGPEDAEAAGP